MNYVFVLSDTHAHTRTHPPILIACLFFSVTMAVFLIKILMDASYELFLLRREIYESVLLDSCSAFFPRESIIINSMAAGTNTNLTISAVRNGTVCDVTPLVRLFQENRDIITLLQIIGVDQGVFENVAIPAIVNNVCAFFVYSRFDSAQAHGLYLYHFRHTVAYTAAARYDSWRKMYETAMFTAITTMTNGIAVTAPPDHCL